MIVLIGFMGAGKTTVGRLLAAELGLPFTDSDQVIEKRARRPIPRIFADDGEPAFRQLEHQVIAGLLAGPDAVLALGGGAASHPLTRSLLAPVPVVYLRVGYTEAMSRVGGDKGRPMLARPDISALYAQRQSLYASLATVTVDTDARPPNEITLEVLAVLDGPRAPAPGPSRPPPGTRRPDKPGYSLGRSGYRAPSDCPEPVSGHVPGFCARRAESHAARTSLLGVPHDCPSARCQPPLLAYPWGYPARAETMILGRWRAI